MRSLAMALALLCASGNVSADDEAVLRSLSSKQAMLKRFQNEYQSAASVPEKKADAERLKQKMRLLESEIAVLQKKTIAAASAPASEPAEPEASHRRSFDELKGEDWARLNAPDRERFVEITLAGLARNGIHVTGDARHYLDKLTAILEEEPAFEEEYLADLVIFCVYDEEPRTREGIHRLRDSSTIP